jgi:hypothetical protein
MFSTRLFVALLIPVILLGCCLYLVTTGVNRNDVKVAGAVIGADSLDAEVKRCAITEDQGARRLVLQLDVFNGGENELVINPVEFQVVLSHKDRPLDSNGQMVFQPLSSSSYCDEAPGSQSIIPPNTNRSYTLNYWAQTFPQGAEWDDYYLTLECYSSQASLILSKMLTIEGE